MLMKRVGGIRSFAEPLHWLSLPTVAVGIAAVQMRACVRVCMRVHDLERLS